MGKLSLSLSRIASTMLLAVSLAGLSGMAWARSAKMPMPDRNPHRVAKATVPLPDPNPHRTSADKSAENSKPAPPQASSDGTTAEPNPDTSGVDIDEPGAPPFDTILKPLLSYSVSDADQTGLKEVVRLSYNGQGEAAARALAGIHDPAVKKLATWYAFKSDNPDAAPDQIEAFRLANPDWPGQEDLRATAEQRLFLSEASPSAVLAFFASSPPTTGAGKAALASAYLTQGDKTKAHALVVSAWREHFLDDKVEKKILDEFGNMLSQADYQARIDMLLYPDDASLTGEAAAVAKHLSAADQKKVAARIAVVKRRSDAGKLLKDIPDDDNGDDVGLLFNRIQYLRRSDHEEDAWKLLLAAPRDPAKLIDVEQWWIERRVNCRAALAKGDYKIAYQIAAEHGPLTGSSYNEAEFLAGWIALRFLDQPKLALTHFIALKAAAHGSKDEARAEYWLGRTAQALGDRGAAILHFSAAARYPQHYYGQLGRQALDSRPAELAITPAPMPSQTDIDRFLNRDAVKAIGIAHAADLDQLMPAFFIALAHQLPDPQEEVLLCELAKRMVGRSLSVRLGKIALDRDMPLGDYAFPIGVLPSFVRLGDKVDMALLHALSRQESEFNAQAMSPAGARGLMQLMPSTARLVARQFSVKYKPDELTNPAYNVQLGQAHLCDLIKRYDGSYFLALVAYNAGPGRVKEWIGDFGDPRDPGVDPIDWIESIPYTETRNYVMKIMESVQLYRSRLYGKDGALQLWQDLNRGKKEAPVATGVLEVQAKSD